MGWIGEVDSELDCNIDIVAISTILLSIVFNKVYVQKEVKANN